MFHEICLDNFLKHNAERPAFKICPLCRRKIDEPAIKKKTLMAPKSAAADLTVENAFMGAGPVTSTDQVQMTAMKGAGHDDNLL